MEDFPSVNFGFVLTNCIPDLRLREGRLWPERQAKPVDWVCSASPRLRRILLRSILGSFGFFMVAVFNLGLSRRAAGISLCSILALFYALTIFDLRFSIENAGIGFVLYFLPSRSKSGTGSELREAQR
jgi:hypothetical protein